MVLLGGQPEVLTARRLYCRSDLQTAPGLCAEARARSGPHIDLRVMSPTSYQTAPPRVVAETEPVRREKIKASADSRYWCQARWRASARTYLIKSRLLPKEVLSERIGSRKRRDYAPRSASQVNPISHFP